MSSVPSSTTAICIFAYKRPQHLFHCLTALVKNKEARSLDLRIYVDAPSQDSDSINHQDVLAICNRPWSFSSLKVIEREVNYGLYRSIVGGISDTLCIYESAIIIEDDIQASRFLIRFLLDGLSLYKNYPNVASIHGYTPPIIQDLPETFFLRGADCWGWATWRDRWKLFRNDSAAMAQEIRQRELVNEFNLNGHYDYMLMLEAHAAGLSNSWAICWHASCFLANMLTLYPGKSLVKNIGLDGSGEHCEPSEVMESEASQEPVLLELIPVEVDSTIYIYYCNHFVRANSFPKNLPLITSRIKRMLRSIFSRPNIYKLSLTGPYDSYEEASSRSSGYNSTVILDKVFNAVVHVLESNKKYERDGSVFSERPFIDNLRRILTRYLKDDDSVVDFGGGLGGTFINNQDLFGESTHYTVVEQSNFTEAGRKLFLSYGLKPIFVESIYNLPYNPDVMILSAVLQYIPNAVEVLQRTAELMPRLILIDRIALVPDVESEKWWIQHEHSYYRVPLSYPIRPLSLQTILNIFMDYSVVDYWNNTFDPEIPPHAGFLLCRCY